MTLRDTLIERIKREFPERTFTIDEGESLITFAPNHPDVGSIAIEEDGDELTVFIGNFTHWHAACYEGGLTEAQKAESITDEVIDFLKHLFNDEIIMWRSCLSGGLYRKGQKPNFKSWLGTQHKEWVWSGPVENEDTG
ncbi:hypothetical protein [Nitrospira sp. M1]